MGRQTDSGWRRTDRAFRAVEHHLLDAEALVHRGAVSTRSVVRHCLVAGQIALSLVLLTSAGLLIRSLWNLQTVPLGMRTENVIAAPILLRQQTYGSPQQQRLFFEQIESELRSLPGLGDVALSDSVPLGGPVSDITGRLGTRWHDAQGECAVTADHAACIGPLGKLADCLVTVCSLGDPPATTVTSTYARGVGMVRQEVDILQLVPGFEGSAGAMIPLATATGGHSVLRLTAYNVGRAPDTRKRRP